MQMFPKCLVGLIALQASWVWADPFIDGLNEPDILTSRGEDGLAKRLYHINLNFDPSVSAADQRIITQGFQDMQTLATAAANYNFQGSAGNIDGIYRRYFPQGSEQKVQALFRFLAGIPQTWGGIQRTTPDFSQITIKRNTGGALAQGSTQANGNGYTITINNLAMPPIVPQSIQSMMPFSETKTSVKMEMLGAIILHELLHCEQSMTAPIMYFNSPHAGTPQRMTIDDQKQNTIGIPEKSYGSYLSAKLKDNNAPAALINNDNYMYFALEAYWYPIVHPHGTFAPADRECLQYCINLFKGNCLWCWER